MPERVFRSLHDPPLLVDRLLAHGFGAVFSIWSFIGGSALVLSTIYGISLSPSIAEFPLWLTVAVGANIGGGGLLAAIGVLAAIPRRDTAWMMEQVGWWLSGVGWLVYCIAVLISFPVSVLAWGTAAALSVGAFLRIIALHYIEKDARRLKALVEGKRLTSGDPNGLGGDGLE